ncbi:nucleotidyltransferase family protein [Pseudooctadecabacter sp.]|uniref:nucleotidyltransferase family protein n=1 Tax=Pseudooctadecabacter sp. TaxID=1966338 RepID=UPI0035C81291
MTLPRSVLLFAAGLGTRMAPLTDTQPKPMIRVAGKPLLDHALQFCDRLNRVVNVHYKAHQIEEHLKDTDVLISDERTQLLETGGGLKKALPLLNSNPTFTMNTDAVWKGPNPLLALTSAWNPDTMDALLLMIPRGAAVGHSGNGDFIIEPNGALRRGPDTVYSGLQIIKTDGLTAIQDVAFSMWSLWQPMLDAGRMYGVAYDGQWCDVGRPDCIPLAEAMLDTPNV